MVTLQEREKKVHVCGDVLSYMDCLGKEKYDSGKEGTAGLYKATTTSWSSFGVKEPFI